MSQRDKVVQTEHLSHAAAQWLGERCRLTVCAHDDPAFLSAIADADALIVRTYTLVDDSLLDHAPRLRVVGRAGVGLDNINIDACRRRNIEVVYTPDANTQAVVEFVIALMADAMRPRIALDRAVDAKSWNQLRAQTVGARQMNQVTLGILGLGRVGKRLARAAKGIGFSVSYNDLVEIPTDQRFDAKPVSVEALFETSDIISVHIDGRAGNRNFVDARLMNRMKPKSILINTSRGFVVDNLPLAGFLKSHPGALAMIDVHEPEPFGADYSLLALPNARLYPHLASRTEQAMENMSWVVRDVVAVLDGKKPEFPAPF